MFWRNVRSCPNLAQTVQHGLVLHVCHAYALKIPIRTRDARLRLAVGAAGCLHLPRNANSIDIEIRAADKEQGQKASRPRLGLPALSEWRAGSCPRPTQQALRNNEPASTISERTWLNPPPGRNTAPMGFLYIGPTGVVIGVIFLLPIFSTTLSRSS